MSEIMVCPECGNAPRDGSETCDYCGDIDLVMEGTTADYLYMSKCIRETRERNAREWRDSKPGKGI